jgi:sigma-B regulation protein RsbU (phosphoserine phosphatase)
LGNHSVSPQPHVLLVDDEKMVVDMLTQVLPTMGFRVTAADSAREALALLSRDSAQFDVLVTDLRMPGMDGLALIRRANAVDPDLPKIILTGYGTLEEVVEALRLGAHDFLTKPVTERHRLTTALIRAADLRRLRRENVRQREAIERKTSELQATVSELSAANATIRRHAEQLVQDLATAARIQRHLLPSKLPARSGFRFTARFEPSERVSGDYYQVITLDPGHLLTVMADVSGHGVSAAMLTVFLSQSIESALAELGPGAGSQPGQLLAWLNRHLSGLHDEQIMFITMACGHLDLVSGWLTLASAGHELPLLRRAVTGRVEPIEVGGVGLGLLPDPAYDEVLVDLAPGDRLLLYTDGLTEAMSPEGELFGDELLAKTLAEGPQDLEAAADLILSEVHRHTGRSQPEDDICLLLVQRTPA